MTSATHDNDFYAWTQEQAHLLKTGQLHQIDWQNIAEEIEDMGRSEKRQLESGYIDGRDRFHHQLIYIR